VHRSSDRWRVLIDPDLIAFTVGLHLGKTEAKHFLSKRRTLIVLCHLVFFAPVICVWLCLSCANLLKCLQGGAKGKKLSLELQNC